MTRPRTPLTYGVWWPLAPWCPPGEPVGQLRDRQVLVLHGSRDRITDPREFAAYVSRALAPPVPGPAC